MPTINIRVTKEQKKELQRIAAYFGQTLSSFLRSSAIIEAQRVLAQHKPELVKSEKPID